MLTFPVSETPSKLIDLTTDSPFRPANWRWQRAVLRVETKSRRQLGADDDWVRRAARYFRELRKGFDRAVRLDPDLAAAHQLAGQQSFNRFEIESRILARQSGNEIDIKCGLATSVVEIYEELFFDVRDRLDTPSWITHQVLGPKTWQPLERDDIAFVWRICGYKYGTRAIAELTTAVPHSDLLQWGLDAYQLPNSTLDNGLKFLISARRLPFVDEMSRSERRSLARLHQRLIDVDGLMSTFELNLKPAWSELLDPLMKTVAELQPTPVLPFRMAG